MNLNFKDGTFIAEVIESDVLIVGSGAAGMRSAIEAADEGVEVTVVTKGYTGRSGSTVMADADVAVDGKSITEVLNLAGDKRDSQQNFFKDMVIEGEYLNNQKLVEIHVAEAPKQVKKLLEWGVKANKVIKSPGHTYPRGVWISGVELNRALKREVKKRNIELIDNILITDLITDNNCFAGAIGLSLEQGKLYFFNSKTIILCTGGAAALYPYHTTPGELTGDGLALAYRAGIELVDMEFPMFLPYTLLKPKALQGSVFPYDLVDHLNARAFNSEGKRYMKDWAPEEMEKSTRDINSAAAGMEILKGRETPAGGVYLSLKHLSSDIMTYAKEHLPDSLSRWRYGGFDLKEVLPDLNKEMLETIPAAHFWNGGIKINEECETNVKRIYAAGEITGGIHGANRISGNAVTDTQVWGARAGKFAALSVKNKDYQVDVFEDKAREVIAKRVAPIKQKKGVSPIEVRKEIREIAWNNTGLIRDEERLEKAVDKINKLKKLVQEQVLTCKDRNYNLEWMTALENENLLHTLEMVTKSSLLRKESRGALYRRDFPQTDNKDWLRNIIIKQINGKMSLTARPVIITSLTPSRVVREYGKKGVEDNE